MKEDEKVSGRVKLALKASGITQRDLAARAGVSEQTVGNWASGRDGISARNIAVVARALGVSEAWLLTGKTELEESRTLEKLDAIQKDQHKMLMAIKEIQERLDREL